MRRIVFLTSFICCFCFSGFSQNLASLLTGRNINSTFSIIGYDPEVKEWGIAVATDNVYVGNSTCYVQLGIGAFSVIAETEPLYAINGFEQLKLGKSTQQAIEYTSKQDSLADFRQVSAIDANGNVFAFTGSSLKYWKGTSTHILGEHFAVMGNQLSSGTLNAMAATFEQTKGKLAERLLMALIAGEKAGGQISGKQSAALLVKGLGYEWFNQIDLRVDHSTDPFSDLQRLLDYHYGRIMINQANNAIRLNNKELGKDLLHQAILKTRGWYGIYPQIVKAYLLLGDTTNALRMVKQTVNAAPKWKEHLSAFYCLYSDPALRELYPESKFTLKDWNNAISMMLDLNQTGQAMTLAEKVLKTYPESSHTWYLMALALKKTGKIPEAKMAAENALKYDPENAQARRLK